MRIIFPALSLFISFSISAQPSDKFSLLLQLSPELVFTKNNYSLRPGTPAWEAGKNLSASFSCGGQVSVRYEFAAKLFSELGLGYISRKLNTKVFFNQAAIPPPRQSHTQELVSTRTVDLRTLDFPLTLGYKFKEKKNCTWYGYTSLAGKYLLNADYNLKGNYAGSYKKNQWQGYSLDIGTGTDFKLKRNIHVAARVGFSVINTVKADEYLLGPDDSAVYLKYKKLGFLIGIKLPISF